MMMMGGEAGDAKMKRQSYGGRVGGGGFFFVDKVLIFAEAETEAKTSGQRGGGLSAQHPTGPYLICVDAPWACCYVSQVAVVVSLGPAQRWWWWWWCCA